MEDDMDDVSQKIYQAIISGDIHGVKSLLGDRKNIDCRNYENATPICVAANYGQMEIAAYLLTLHPDLSLSDNDGKSPIHLALCANLKNVSEPKTVTAMLLLACGAEISSMSDSEKAVLSVMVNDRLGIPEQVSVENMPKIVSAIRAKFKRGEVIRSISGEMTKSLNVVFAAAIGAYIKNWA